MAPRRELLLFAAALALILAGFFGESLWGGRVLSPADVLFAQASFRTSASDDHEPGNRLLMDPVLQFQPWLEFSRAMLRRGRLPLWNDLAGCGAPHLANGQSAVFDPFHAIAYLGRLPEAHAWMAAARLWIAGLGMFLLARAWGFGPWGRWFSGLAFPFCGFLVVWLLYPVTSVAVWMPWLFWASERLLVRPSARAVGCVALFVGLTLLGGHVQTSAHVLIAAALYVIWRCRPNVWLAWRAEAGEPVSRRALPAWSAGAVLGLAMGAVAVVPLGYYLTRSPVWVDRVAERPSVWTIAKPRLLDALCTALPYAYGSQRRDHPNLAKALGVHNLNESAGGFAGLATLLWLAPLAWSARRRQPRVWFLGGLGAVGALGAFGLPPVINLLRAIPVVNVTDTRRLVLWVAFALVTLGGIGLDHLHASRRGTAWARWAVVWMALAALLLIAAMSVRVAAPSLRSKAQAHYAQAAAETPGADAAVYSARAERQVRQTLSFMPRYLGLTSAQLLALAGLMALWRRGRVSAASAKTALLGLTMVDLLGFGYGLNPAITRAADRPTSPVIEYLTREVGRSGRVLGLGGELPPNTLMRYGLADVRNYDSVELERSLDWFAPLYEDDATRSARTSRRMITWSGVLRSLDRLREARVLAIVAATPPPPESFKRVDHVGNVWVARLPRAAFATSESSQAQSFVKQEPGLITIKTYTDVDDMIRVPVTFDPGWHATVDGRSVVISPDRGAFLAAHIPEGAHTITFTYRPLEVLVPLGISVIALGVVLFALVNPVRAAAKKQLNGLDGPNQAGYNRKGDLYRTSLPVFH
jgi:Bacterial membrane protein YfhO